MRSTKPLGSALRLEIESDPAPGELVNLVPNPNGELGGWGWVTPLANSTIARGDLYGGSVLFYSKSTGGQSYFTTENLPVVAGRYVAASLDSPSANAWFRLRFEWINAAGAVISSSAQSADMVFTLGPFVAPAGTAFARLRVDLYRQDGSGANPAGANQMTLNRVTVAEAATTGQIGESRTNLVPNPSFEADLTGWEPFRSPADVTLARTTTTNAHGDAAMTVTSSAGTTRAYSGAGLTSAIPVVGNLDYTFQAAVRCLIDMPLATYFGITWHDAAGGLLSSTYEPAGAGVTIEWQTFARTITAPPSAVALLFSVHFGPFPAGVVPVIDAVMVEQASTVGPFIVGTVNSTALPYIPPLPSINILGPAHDITVNRRALDVGTLSATVVDATLDPSQSTAIRPGRAVRLRGYDEASEQWEPVFTGIVSAASVDYALTEPQATKRARIELTAVDPAQILANQRRALAYATLGELAAVLEGAGVPWNVNGSGTQVTPGVVVATNDNASALDQVAVARDTALGYAWVDRRGVLQAWDRARISAAPVGTVLDEDTYRDVRISYNTGDLINEVSLKFLRLNPTDGTSEEIPYGPYRDEESIRTWGVSHADFTIQGIAEETSDLAGYAQAILDANSTPVVRLNTMTLDVALSDDAAAVASWYGFADLYDMVVIDCDRAGIVAEQSRVTGIKHTISGPDSSWQVDLSFTDDNVVASPSYVPSPSAGGGDAIGRLLRPVGELTMFYGPKAQIPAGWLACDGGAIPGEHGDLIALIGPYTPDMTDRFPIGAGTKALATVGGEPTKPPPSHTHAVPGSNTGSTGSAHTHEIPAAAMPTQSDTATTGAATRVSGGSAHTHGGVALSTGSTHTHDVSGVQTGTPSPGADFDVLNPWRALWFIIRAA